MKVTVDVGKYFPLDYSSEEAVARLLADKVIKKYRERLMNKGWDIGYLGERKIIEYIKKKMKIKFNAEVVVTFKELDKLVKVRL